MSIRHATPADIPQILALEQQTDTAAHWSSSEYEVLFAKDDPRRLALVVSADDKPDTIQGFLVARCLPDEWEIENVVVAVQKRQQGLGAALVHALLARARSEGARAVLLEVRESNQSASQLYEKIGFKETGRRPGYYQNPAEDALLYEFSISVL